MRHPSSFQPLPPVGAQLYGAVSPVSEVEFFPKLLWQRRRITPLMWKKDAVEPVVVCRMETDALNAATEREYLELVAQMRAQGWHWDIMDGGHRDCHIDEIEKCSGVPGSDGPF